MGEWKGALEASSPGPRFVVRVCWSGAGECVVCGGGLPFGGLLVGDGVDDHLPVGVGEHLEEGGDPVGGLVGWRRFPQADGAALGGGLLFLFGVVLLVVVGGVPVVEQVA